MSHTKEPWSYGEDNDGWYIEVDGVQIAFGLSESDARRIVACVNACTGIPNEVFERDQPRFVAILKQRTEFLALLSRASDSIAAAIAKVGAGRAAP